MDVGILLLAVILLCMRVLHTSYKVYDEYMSSLVLRTVDCAGGRLPVV